jgi:hypothetical protein
MYWITFAMFTSAETITDIFIGPWYVSIIYIITVELWYLEVSVYQIFFSVPIIQYWTCMLSYFGVSNFHMSNFSISQSHYPVLLTYYNSLTQIYDR